MERRRAASDAVKSCLVVAGLALAAACLTQGHALAAAASPAAAGAADQTIALRWLDGHPPVSAAGVSWGVPWPRGAVQRNTPLTVFDREGQSIATQTWPLAFWPDGSLKWSGLAIAGDEKVSSPLSVARGSTVAPQAPVFVQEGGNGIEISTGLLHCRIARTGRALVESLVIDGREVGRNGRLIAIREDRTQDGGRRVVREEDFTGRITSVSVEQSGPVRAVVHIQGVHVSADSSRMWLPFSVRLYFTAGLSSVRMVHSFVVDGDADKDFIRGLGLAFTVPFREEKQNRHVRFAGESDGLWAESVLMSPSYRDGMVKDALQMSRDQLAGKRIPNLSDLGATTKTQIEIGVATWDAFKLSQLSADSYAIEKRTGAVSSWLRADVGRRARGFVFLGDVSGGLAVGVKRFWEKHPSSLEISGGSMAAGELKVWFWSPDAPAMDLRRYDTVGHEGRISYEDFEPGFGTPEGIANTSELTLWATPNTPNAETLAAMAQTANATPLLVCTPEYYHAVGAFGPWSLPDRSTADRAAMEDQLDRAWRFFTQEVEQRRWYGFWDFGDVMRTYDKVRHRWMYDIGGHAWNNTELMTDTWLWLAFLRTGRADAFRFAEATTRHTSEVDVHHAGRFAGFGTRHNVNHWGDSAKEVRISAAFLKRPYYYLTTDERTGDLMREVLTVDEKLAEVQPLRKTLPRPDVPVVIRSGPDWIALASNWLTEWERTGELRYRDYVLAGMKSLGAMPEAFQNRIAYRYDPKTKQLFDIGAPNLKTYEFVVLFGGDQIAHEMMQLIDCLEFKRAWYGLYNTWAREKAGPGYTIARIAGYAALESQDATLGRKAWEILRASLQTNGRDRFPATMTRIDGPIVPRPIDENGIDAPGTAQWALSLIITPELVRQFYVPPSSR